MADAEQLRRAKLHVEKAIKEKKIFAVQGPYPVIRRLLRARGWVERKLPRNGKQLKQQAGNQKKRQPHNKRSKAEGEDEDKKEEKEQCSEDSDDIHDLMSFLVQDQVPNFLWTICLNTIDQELLQRIEVVNRYPRLHALCTKEGLCQSLQNLSWFEQVDLNTFFPRCYRLGIMEEQEAFIEDFCLTAARNLLKLAVEKVGDRLVGTEQPPKSNKVPGSPLYPHLVEEALEVCEQHLGILGHQDIDRETPSPCRTCIAWDHFLQEYYHVAHEGARLVLSKEQREKCQGVLQRLGEQLPQLGMEGNLNVWILKPSTKSRGRGKAGGSMGHTHPYGEEIPPSLCCPGIICATRLEEVLELSRSCTAPAARVCEWVVQKYVEQPLTIFNTKFDIRQWFVVTDWKPLTVWFYRDCYLRFCSQPFSLRCLEPARHLCNVSIQKRYKTSQPDPRVPLDKIWSNKQFQAYLARLGRADAWHRVMVPGMKAAILNALRCTQDQVGSHKGSFELFGADFLIGEDCQPWLLEINSCPTMSPSSAVTRRLCANVQRDTLRLVLDRKDNPSCPIGAFELLYKEAAMPTCLHVGLKLMVEGCSLKKPRPARSQDKPPAPSGDRATEVPRSRAAPEKLSPLGPRSSCYLPRSDLPALPQPPDCSAGSQELPWFLHLVGQPEEAQHLLSSCPMDRVPGPSTQGAPRSPWQPPGYSAGDQELPWLLHLVVGQPEEAQPQEDQPQAALPPITSCPLVPLPPPRAPTRSPWRPPGSSDGTQELPWLLHLVGQLEDAQPPEAHTQEAQPKATPPSITSRPLDKLPPLQGARRSSRRSPGCSAGSQGLPQLSQPGGQPQAAWSYAVLPPINARPPDLQPGQRACLRCNRAPGPRPLPGTEEAHVSSQEDAEDQGHANETPLLHRSTHLYLHACFNRLL
ncbi:tubulin tyrosine ligase 3-like [Cyanocitta cristata]